MTERIGVYICECGPNIKDATDLDDIVDFAHGLDNVVLARTFRLLCSDEGKEFLKKEIKEQNLTRVVIAACSPKEHEIDFKKVLKEAGLNPFLLQIANIREQCAWVIKDKSLATEKAKVTLKAAVKRVLKHEQLETKEMECQTDVLVIGAGITGISAALTLAQKGRKVYLVEKSPCLGGKVTRYEEVFPNMECAPCMLDPLLDEVLHDEHIELLTLSEVQEVLGSYGNFIVKVKTKARFIDPKTCIGCGACFEVCPVNVKNEYNEGLNERKAIYIPYAGSLPNVAVIDKEHCLNFRGKDCSACQQACPFACINYDETDQVKELQVGAIVLATGFDLFDLKKVPQYGHGKIENIYTSLEFERLLSSTGPTGGNILLKNGQPPKKIALIHCVGSRSKKYNEYCSEVCCLYLLKFAHLAKKKLPEVSVVDIYSDFCLPGKSSQGFFNKVAEEKGIENLYVKDLDSIRVMKENGGIVIKYVDGDGQSKGFTCDMVVLAPSLEGSRDAKDLARVFDILQDQTGFFIEEHPMIKPVSTTTEGIFIAGCAQGSKDIPTSVAQGQSAAGRILSRLVPGEKLVLETMIAVVDEELCSGCKTCVGICSYNAINYDSKKKQAVVNEVLCRGCGTCVASCPSGALKGRHSTDEQISVEITGLLR